MVGMCIQICFATLTQEFSESVNNPNIATILINAYFDTKFQPAISNIWGFSSQNKQVFKVY